MLLTKLEKQLELGKKLAAAMNWNLNTITISIGRVEVRLHGGNFREILISEKSGIKNKMLNVESCDYKINKRRVLLKYKKPPENTKHYPKQRPSKDNLFNYSLEMNIVVTHEELDKLEDVMDEYEGIIFISIGLGTY